MQEFDFFLKNRDFQCYLIILVFSISVSAKNKKIVLVVNDALGIAPNPKSLGNGKFISPDVTFSIHKKYNSFLSTQDILLTLDISTWLFGYRLYLVISPLAT